MTDTEFKKILWDAAVKLRGSLSAAEYKYPVLGLVFLKYVSDAFDAQADVIRARAADPQSDKFIDDPVLREELVADWIKDKSFYEEDNVFWIPEASRYPALLAQAKHPGIAHKLDAAMAAIEVENPKLRGVLYRDFGRLELDAGKIGDLLANIAKMHFDPKEHASRDVFGEVYEYLAWKPRLSATRPSMRRTCSVQIAPPLSERNSRLGSTDVLRRNEGRTSSTYQSMTSRMDG